VISRRAFVALTALGLVHRGSEIAYAQSYPGRLIKIVVPFPPGGPTDLVARLAGRVLSLQLGQNVIIENLPGAGGTIGSQLVARANPDGYTLLLGGTNSNAITPSFYKNLNYDPIGGFAPVASIAVDSSALVVVPDVPARTIDEFVQYAKQNPGKVTCGAPIGVAPHVMVQFFMGRIGASSVFVPYKGGAPLITDLLSGQVQMTFGAKSAFLPQIQAGKLRALAVTSEGRWPELPDVPTMGESGFADFPAYQWFDLLAPAGTPAAVVDKLNRSILEGMKSPEIVASLAKLGIEPRVETPHALATILNSEALQWGELVRLTGIKID
jgi:tripartite-type tricarboxylate transporter receptor subunit TctC